MGQKETKTEPNSQFNSKALLNMDWLDGVGNCSQFGSILALDSCIPRIFTVFEGAITITLVADNQK